ncbi:MAG: tyrosine-type recombinase/integrase [Actinomycetota bacterium]
MYPSTPRRQAPAQRTEDGSQPPQRRGPALTGNALCVHLERHAEPGADRKSCFAPRRRPAAPGHPLYDARQRARAEVGADNVTVHDLRHAGATLAAQAGATTRELMARLGHSSPRAALRYQHASTARDRELAARLDELFTRPRDGRAMETNVNEAEIDDNTSDLGL